MSDLKAAAKLANVSLVFSAAKLLHELGLQVEEPATTLRRYVEANPDMVDLVSRHPHGLADQAGATHEEG